MSWTFRPNSIVPLNGSSLGNQRHSLRHITGTTSHSLALYGEQRWGMHKKNNPGNALTFGPFSTNPPKISRELPSTEFSITKSFPIAGAGFDFFAFLSHQSPPKIIQNGSRYRMYMIRPLCCYGLFASLPGKRELKRQA